MPLHQTEGRLQFVSPLGLAALLYWDMVAAPTTFLCRYAGKAAHLPWSMSSLAGYLAALQCDPGDIHTKRRTNGFQQGLTGFFPQIAAHGYAVLVRMEALQLASDDQSDELAFMVTRDWTRIIDLASVGAKYMIVEIAPALRQFTEDKIKVLFPQYQVPPGEAFEWRPKMDTAPVGLKPTLEISPAGVLLQPAAQVPSTAVVQEQKRRRRAAAVVTTGGLLGLAAVLWALYS